MSWLKRSLKRNYERGFYLIFLISLNFSFIIIRILSQLSFLFPLTQKKDIILFPYYFAGSDGYNRRFYEYFAFFERSGISYHSCILFTKEYADRILYSTNAGTRYLFYLRILWKRIFQVLKARHYKAAFIQRGLFPFYFDLKYPYLEKLLRKLNKNITVDFWDTVLAHQAPLVRRSLENADKVTVSNRFLYNDLSTFHEKRFIWEIGINTGVYRIKPDYSIRDEFRLIWTGSPSNFEAVYLYKETLKQLAASYPLKLIVVSPEDLYLEGVNVENHRWSNPGFYELLRSADIGIYPEFNNLVSRGKSAMKVMDYFASALPVIGVPYGMPDCRENEEALFAEGPEAWVTKLSVLFNDEALRRKLGQNARKFVEHNHSLEASYKKFTDIIFTDIP